MTPREELREAAALLRSRAGAAARTAGERWIAATTDDGLAVCSYTPADVDEQTGAIATSVVATFAYPGDKQLRAPAGSLAVAWHIAALDPPVALALADLLDLAAEEPDDPPIMAGQALTVALRYLRRGGGQR